MRADRTIAITQKTKDKLRGLKKYERETMDDIINKLLEQNEILVAVASKEGVTMATLDELKNKIIPLTPLILSDEDKEKKKKMKKIEENE